MKVFSIDPGPVKSAFVLWNGAAIIDSAHLENEHLRRVLKIQIHQNETLAIVCEKIASYGMAVGASVFETCFETGRLWEIADSKQRQFHLLERGKVKMHLCQSMRAKDSNIRQALIDRFGAPGTKKNQGLTFGLSGDKWAAFALAVTWFDQNASPQPSKQSAKH
jgi:hypothetical protein